MSDNKKYYIDLGQERSMLNPEQLKAVMATEGPLLIFAGAGSGKTMVITHRIARLIELGVAPYNILAVTFTNKAAAEMSNRIHRLAGSESYSVWVSTFHSLAMKILRVEGDREFTIYDEQDQVVALKQAIKNLDLDKKKYTPYYMKEVISNAKNNLMDIESFRINAMSHADIRRRTAADIYEEYQKILEKNGGYDFSDLLVEFIHLLKRKPEVLQKYQHRFKYVLVDEYQDTNYAQYVILKLLVPPQNNICVVGDDDQSIYSWRGADIRNILEFEKQYESAQIMKLEENYRSTKSILEAAHSVIRNNSSRKSKKLWTRREQGSSVKWHEFLSNREEAVGVVSEINRLVDYDGYSLSDIAVFYRINAQTRSFEDVLRSSGVNYKIIGGLKFYERKEIKDILAYMRVIINKFDDISLLRIINCPARGIGNKTVEALRSLAAQEGQSLYQLIMYSDGVIPDKINKKLVVFRELFARLEETVQEDDASKLAKEIIELSGYHRMLEEGDDIQSRSRIENIEELVSAFAEKENQEKSITEILNEISLLTDADLIDESDEYITLMTVHLAKGLEFPIVFLTGLEEELFPHYDALNDPAQMEEERRLCYVGMTRAKDLLYLTSASQRMLYGQTRWHLPSRFVKECSLSEEDDGDYYYD